MPARGLLVLGDSSTQVALMEEDESSSEEHAKDPQIDRSILRLEIFLRVLGFCQYSAPSFILSWLAFLFLAFLLPLGLLIFSECSDCKKYQIKRFELHILLSETLLSAISLLSISYSIRKRGVRKFLFLDRCSGSVRPFRKQYLHMIKHFFRSLAILILPCLILKSVREIIRLEYIPEEQWWHSVGLLVSWIYRTTIYLSGSALFNLVCNLQLIHFDNYAKLLEKDEDVSLYIEEHKRLSGRVFKISHIFQVYLFLNLLLVTVNQFIALIQTSGNQEVLNFINGGGFIVASIVQLVGVAACLHAASMISHRARSLRLVAARWHADVTCSFTNPLSEFFSDEGSSQTSSTKSQNDLDSAHFVPTPLLSSYFKREAFMRYLETNSRGATIYGWPIDEALVTNIFFNEMFLVLLVLRKLINFNIV